MLRTQSWPLLVAASLLLAGSSAALRGSLAGTAGGTSGQSSASRASASNVALRTAPLSPADLEIGGDLAGLPAGATRYLTRDDLLALPQVQYTVSDDSNFAAPPKVSGVELEELVRRFGASPQSDLVAAICDDKYRAHYPRAYLAAHHPLLVLNINGQPPAGWPKDPEGNDMGPYLISHPKFTPSFEIFAHPEEPQIPWGVVRIEFRNEESVYAAIAPRGPIAGEPVVKSGFGIARQSCFHCHNQGDEGGQKAGLPWQALAGLASSAPDFFAAYVRDPKSKNPKAQMPGNPHYDDATIGALTAYFRAFASASKP